MQQHRRDYVGEVLGDTPPIDDVPPPESLDDYGEVSSQGAEIATAAIKWRFLCDHKPTAPRMLIKGIAPHRGILFIGGQSGAGKTFIETHLANALAGQARSSDAKCASASVLLSSQKRAPTSSATGSPRTLRYAGWI